MMGVLMKITEIKTAEVSIKSGETTYNYKYIRVYTDEGKEVDLMQDINPRRNTPSRPTYESLGTSEYEED